MLKSISALLLLALLGTGLISCADSGDISQDSETSQSPYDPAVCIFVDGSSGDDANDGTENHPLKTLATAQKLMRKKKKDMSADMYVIISGGTYYLDQTLIFSRLDSGENGHSIIWTARDGENVVISGGSEVTGWTLSDSTNKIYKAGTAVSDSRDLFVNGVRATRAVASSPLSNIKLTETGITTNCRELKDVTNPDDIEFVLKNCWNQPRISATDIETEGDTVIVTLDQPGWTTYLDTATLGGAPAHESQFMYVENAHEFLDKPGEWYLDRKTQTVYYIPLEGEDMSTATAVLGRLENLIEFNGSPKEPVENISFKSLTFSHTTWMQSSKPEGLLTIQANFYKKFGTTSATQWEQSNWVTPSAAVNGTYLRSFVFEGNTFENLGNGGLHLGRSTKNSSITSNVFTDCASTAIALGGFENIDHHPISKNGNDRDANIIHISENNSICNNTITRAGSVYKAGVGILVGYTSRTKINYNTLSDLPYSGISLGWGWGFNGSELPGMMYEENGKFLICDNEICYNRIDDIMNYLYDGGAIYTLGRMDGTVINNNYISSVNNEFGGIYLDNGSYGITVTDNVLEDCFRNYIYKGNCNDISENYAVKNTHPDMPMLEVYGKKTDYVFEDNYLEQDNKSDSIKAAAGAR